MANTPMYQTGPSNGGLAGILQGANTAMGGIMAEAIESKKAQTNYLNFADVLEKQGLIGDAMIYRQMASSETPNLIQAARSGQATKRDMDAPFQHALKALSDAADRKTRIDIARENDSNSLSSNKAAYNAADEIDSADLQIVTSELNGIDNRRYNIQNRLSEAEKAGDAALVQQLESDLQQLDSREKQLRDQGNSIQSKRRSRQQSAFSGVELPSDGGPISAEMTPGGSSLPGELFPSNDATADQMPVFTEDGGPNVAGAESLLPDESMRKGIRKEPARNQAVANAFAGKSSAGQPTEAQSVANAFAGKSSVTETRGVAPAPEPVIPDIQPTQPGVKENNEQSNSELAAQGKLDYTKNLGLPSDASSRTVRARRNFLESKQQAFIQNGGSYDEGIDKAQTPEQLKTALAEALKTKRKQTGLETEDAAKQAGDAMLSAMGKDSENFVAKIERKGPNNFDVDLVRKSAVGVTKVGQMWTSNGKVFAPDASGVMVKVNPNTQEQEYLPSLDPNNPDKKVSSAEFSEMVRKYSPEVLAGYLGISVEEAKQFKVVLIGENVKEENKGAQTTIAPDAGNNVYKAWKQ